jgi:hypothetical protein
MRLLLLDGTTDITMLPTEQLIMILVAACQVVGNAGFIM